MVGNAKHWRMGSFVAVKVDTKVVYKKLMYPPYEKMIYFLKKVHCVKLKSTIACHNPVPMGVFAKITGKDTNVYVQQNFLVNTVK